MSADASWPSKASNSSSACAEWPKPWFAPRAAEGVEAIFVNTPEEAGERIAAELRPNDAVLMKASRGVRLERALEILKSRKDASRGCGSRFCRGPRQVSMQ